MDLKLKDKNVIVSASSKGIGFATAKLFLEEGANVTILSSKKENLDDAQQKLSVLPGRVNPVVCDINNYNDIKEAVKSTRENLGEIHILVNNCGGPKAGYFEDLTEDDWMKGYNQVLLSAVRFTREVLPDMVKNKFGRIINVTSLSVKQPVDNLLLSNTFRTALTSFTKTLSNQYAKHNITFNNVAPGYALTERLTHLADIQAKVQNISSGEILENMASGVPLKRVGEPEEIAAFIVFLASAQGSYANGLTIPVDGGIIKSLF